MKPLQMSINYWKKFVLSFFFGVSTFVYLVTSPTMDRFENVDPRLEARNTFSLDDTLANSFCWPKKHVMFLKTHKCGSSTVQNIFLRFGSKHNLTFALPSGANYLGRGLPFRKSMIPNHLLPSNGLVDIFCMHTRLNKTNLEEVLHTDTVWITIIREPVSLYESLFSFYHLVHTLNISLEQLVLYPVEEIMEMPRRAGTFGFNQMLFDLGANPKLKIHELQRKISELDKIFDIILIVEKLEESLILMREKLCWTNEDIVVFTKNARRKKEKLKPELVEKIRDLNSADTILYNYFLSKHNEEVLKFGQSRMKNEVTILKQKIADYYELCVTEKVPGKDKRLEFKEYSDQVNTYIKSNDTSLDCHLLTLPELPFVSHVRYNQKNYLHQVFKNYAQNSP